VDPRFVGSNPAESDGFIRLIKIGSRTSFGEEGKPSRHVVKFDRVKEPLVI
jgi:hypothetical protein